MRASIERLRKVAIEEGIHGKDFTQYPNYALVGAGAEELYGVNNAARLRDIRRRIDPDRVMDLAGGFQI